MIDQKIQKALFIEIHQAIENATSTVINDLEGSGDSLEVTYPPGYAPLTPEEKIAIQNLKLSEEALSGLKKLILDAASYPLFHLFALMDGVTDLETGDFNRWYGISFCQKKKHRCYTMNFMTHSGIMNN